MAHEQQAQWVKGLIGDALTTTRMAGKVVLELGSYDVNGSVRKLFYGVLEPGGGPREYIGVDWRAGPGVDHICHFHDIPWTAYFDVLISCNTFEHDPYWKRSIGAGIRALKPGGEIIIMAAGPGYPAHEITCAPTPEYYGNIEPSELQSCLEQHGAHGVLTVFTNPADVAFHGHKRSPPPAG